ncbi:MAG: ArsA family ATPase [Labilithrix sp.]|nr:ArsA family ATPase [Labilithrix sp.]
MIERIAERWDQGSGRTTRGSVAAVRRLTFFGGKGGVGKTTCAAAAATRAAREGATVLVVSTDPAHSLADALDAKLGAAPQVVARGGGLLFAAQLDADRALSRWLGERRGAFKTIAERGTYLDEEDVDALFSLSLPGVDELVGLLELARLARSRAFDHVVVDTAPTGHTLRLLEMPDTLLRVAEVLDDMHAKHRFLASSLGGRWRPDFADEIIAGVERDATELRAWLRDPARCSFTWITLPEALPIDESEDGVRAIESLGIAVPTIVVNRVWSAAPAPVRRTADGPARCASCDPRLAAEAANLARIRRVFPHKRILELPALDREPRGVEALADLAARARRTRPAMRAARVALPEARGARTTPGVLELAPSIRLVLVGGKGGVGKTTAACALALDLAASRPKERVLLLSIDPAHSVGDALGMTLGDDAARVAGGPKNLHARELDAARAFEIEREKYRDAIDDLFASIFRGRMDASFDRAVLEDLLDLAPPGLDELFAILAMIDALDRGEEQLLVVDTAPTGHTLRLLALPANALAWVHAIMSIILKYRRVVGLGELASDLTRLAKRLRALMALLADPKRTAFVAVTRAADLPRLETERLASKLREMRVPLAAIVVNAVTEGGQDRCARCNEAAAAERAPIERLARRAPTLIRAPAVHPPPRGPAALQAWYARWQARAMLPRRR